MNPTAPTVTKRCEWNRYCAHVAPFYSERLLEIGTNRPLLIGRCYQCEGFVCNRCASRKPHETGSEGSAVDSWELLCPLDGHQLGRGDDWIVFSGTAESLSRSTGPPEERLLTHVFSLGLVWTADSPEATTILQMLEQAFVACATDQRQTVLDISTSILGLQPNHVNALLLQRWALEKLHRFDEAWETLRAFLQSDADRLTRGLGELNALKSTDDETRSALTAEILSALRTAAPAAKNKLVREAVSKLIAEIAPELALPASDPAEPPDRAAAPRLAAQPQPATTPVVPYRRSPDFAGASRRELVTAMSPDLLTQILSRFPANLWNKDEWTQFAVQCQAAGALASLDAASFAHHVWSFQRGPEMTAHALSAQMLIETGRAVAETKSLDLTGLFDLYAGECFLRSPQLRACFGASEDPTLTGELAASQSFKTGDLPDIDTLAHLLIEAALGHTAIEEWAAALIEYARECPMLIESAGALSFSHKCFEDYFLSRHLFRRLFQDEKPDLKLAGLRCFDLDTAIFLADLIMRSDKHLTLLDEWLRMKRQRRSLFRGADVPVLVRNLALVRLMIKNDARSLDLTDADFSGLDLNHADFSDSILAGANFRNTDLRGARFIGCDLTGATFDGSDLTAAELDPA